MRASDELDESKAPVTSDDCDTRLDIASALSRLGCTEREIVTLRAVAGASFREISVAVGLPLGTVYFKYRQAIAALRDMLS